MNKQMTTFYQLLTAALQDADNADQLAEVFIKHCPTPGDFQRLSLEAENELLMESKGAARSTLGGDATWPVGDDQSAN